MNSPFFNDIKLTTCLPPCGSAMNYPFSRQKHERPLPASDEPLGHLDADQGEEGHQHRKREIQHDLNIYTVKLGVLENFSEVDIVQYPTLDSILYRVRLPSRGEHHSPALQILCLSGKRINIRGAMFTDKGGQQRVYTRKAAFSYNIQIPLANCQNGV
jgi:hypothetical protein